MISVEIMDRSAMDNCYWSNEPGTSVAIRTRHQMYMHVLTVTVLRSTSPPREARLAGPDCVTVVGLK